MFESVEVNHRALASRLRVLHSVDRVRQFSDDAKRSSPRMVQLLGLTTRDCRVVQPH